MTILCGAFTAAIETKGSLAIALRTVVSSVATLTIFPPWGKDCINRPRAATRRRASSSDRTPAMQAATYSPIL